MDTKVRDMTCISKTFEEQGKFRFPALSKHGTFSSVHFPGQELEAQGY